MPLDNKRQAALLGELGQAVGKRGAVLDRTKSPRGPGLRPCPNWSTAHRSMSAALSVKPYR